MNLTEIEYLDGLRILIHDMFHDMLQNNGHKSFWPFKAGNQQKLSHFDLKFDINSLYF